MMSIPITIAAGIHNGDSTHHHDHVIKFVSFKTIKAIVNKPAKPIPPEAVFVCDINVLFLYFKNWLLNQSPL